MVALAVVLVSAWAAVRVLPRPAHWDPAHAHVVVGGTLEERARALAAHLADRRSHVAVIPLTYNNAGLRAGALRHQTATCDQRAFAADPGDARVLVVRADAGGALVAAIETGVATETDSGLMPSVPVGPRLGHAVEVVSAGTSPPVPDPPPRRV
ncbi:MAG: hypothetical protein QN183_10800 [Armatimonadota bacterium]|nr:hypothetical protein [Armatimonadota bacterium]MDR7534376.1 hypothetical protein [Armatimonadota bacterium]MDR7536841.1 hypothetical protein [Armatimonadota bacterium]